MSWVSWLLVLGLLGVPVVLGVLAPGSRPPGCPGCLGCPGSWFSVSWVSRVSWVSWLLALGLLSVPVVLGVLAPGSRPPGCPGCPGCLGSPPPERGAPRPSAARFCRARLRARTTGSPLASPSARAGAQRAFTSAKGPGKRPALGPQNFFNFFSKPPCALSANVVNLRQFKGQIRSTKGL